MSKLEGLIDKTVDEFNRGASEFGENRLRKFERRKLPSHVLLPLIEWPIALGVWLVGAYQIILAMRSPAIGAELSFADVGLFFLACIVGMYPMAIYSLLAETHRKTPLVLLIDVVAVGAIFLWFVVPVHQSYVSSTIQKAKIEAEIKAKGEGARAAAVRETNLSGPAAPPGTEPSMLNHAMP